jgi:hypothetical protein
MLSRLVKPWPCPVVDRLDETVSGLVVHLGEEPVTPAGVEEFVVIDIPSSMHHLERSVDPPRKTTVLHVARSFDDACAIAAVREEPLSKGDIALIVADLRRSSGSLANPATGA